MSSVNLIDKQPRRFTDGPGFGNYAIRLILVVVIDILLFFFVSALLREGFTFTAATSGLIGLGANIILLYNPAYPMRWMLIGLVLMAMFAIYPIIFTVTIAFTNFGDGHLLSKNQAIEKLQNERYLPEGGDSFTWTAFVRKTDDGDEFALWLQKEGLPGRLATAETPITIPEAGTDGVGEFDNDGIPIEIDGYDRLNRLSVVRYINALGAISFGTDDEIVQVRSLDDAAELVPLYSYDAETDVLSNRLTGREYTAINGFFSNGRGDDLIPGFQSDVGWLNFERFFTSSALRGPLVRIITWNFAFAFLSVATTFALGLGIAYIYNDPDFPGKKILQSFLLIPYTIPGLITILIWRGMMNPEVGVINNILNNLIGVAPPWTTDATWAKVAILIVNLWLGYPYFMLICSGALQAIPEDIYSAAEVDGASPWQRFRYITLPLLFVAVGPLLIASFTFNFNNFNLIFLFIGGGPPIADSAARAGHTDILISYVYNLAFSGGRGADYGLASAVTIIIFFIVAIITLTQFRWTRMLEEVSESV